MYESMDGSNDDKDVYVTASKTPVERPGESEDSIAMDGRQHHDVKTNRNLQDPTTNRPTSVLSGTESHQLYERIYDSDEEYTFVTAPTTPAELSSQQHQNPLPLLLTDVSTRLRSMQASHSPPQPVYSYCDVLPTKTSLKSDDQPHHSTNGQGAGVSVHGGSANASKVVRIETRRPVLTTLNGQKKNNPESKSQIPAVSVTITSQGIELKLSSSTVITRATKS